MKGFRDFILRGNVVDLAVGVVVGAAFGAVVQAMVKDLLTPFIAALVQQPDFSKLQFTLRGSVFLYGEFLNALISFLIVAAVIYFFVVLPINKMIKRFKKPAEPEPEKKPADVLLLEEIRDLLKEEKRGNNDTIA
jgi:large conductance mechanosensitive channel